jgi:diguanylate cyclase (GGDEF)-like protein/putative nucleotidyltransferase with HDIG domain
MKAASSPSQSRLQMFTWVVIALGAAIFAWAMVGIVRWPPKLDWLILWLVTILIGARASVWLPRGLGKITVSDIFLFFSLLYYGIAPTVVIAVVDGLYSSSQLARNRKQTIFFNAAVMGFSVFCAGWLGQLAFGSIQISPRAPLESLLLLLLIVASAHYLIDSWLVATASSLRHDTPLVRTWRDNFQWAAITFLSSAAVAGLVFRLTDFISVYSFLIVVPIVAVTYLSYRGNLEKVEAAQRHADEVAQLHIETIEALAIAIDAKDQTTHEHVRRVQIYAAGLARIFGLSEAEIEALRAGALLHDVGKLAVPDHILNKPGKLTPAEFEKMKIHTTVGAEILGRVRFPYPVVPIVRYHHERWDGKGYPEGLRGEAIPMTARILSVVDCFDAVREDRPYRCGLTREQAINLLLEGRGSQFDPRVIDAFLERLPQFEAEIAQVLAAEAVAQAQCQTPPDALLLRDNQATPAAGLATEPVATRSTTGYLEQIKSAHHEITSLYEITRGIASLLDLDRMAEVIREKLSPLIPCDTCALFIYQPAEHQAVARHVAGRHAELVQGSQAKPGGGVTGFVLAERQIFSNTDPALDFLELGLSLPESYRNVISCPLLKGEALLGALTLYSLQPDRYTTDHIRLLETISATASDAVYNALRHAPTEDQTATDELTGLPNARHLATNFAGEVSRADRYGYPLMLLSLDLDQFRRVNDRYGHSAGDRVLKGAARLLASQLRRGDILARYAGDQFVVLLHRMTPDLIDDLIVRLQAAFAAWKCELDPAQAISVEVNIGHAMYGEDGRALPELMQAADQRLEHDKAARRLMSQAHAAGNLRIFPGAKREVRS